jgi:hypothetical protein
MLQMHQPQGRLGSQGEARQGVKMIWFFLAQTAVLVGLFSWLDYRQTQRYNLFAQWSQVFSKMLGEDMQQIRSDVHDIKEEKCQRVTG